MRQMLKPLAFLLIAGFAITSCKKDAKDEATDPISEETLTKIYNHGFGTSNVQKIEEGYLVEGDIVLTEFQVEIFFVLRTTNSIAQQTLYQVQERSR